MATSEAESTTPTVDASSPSTMRQRRRPLSRMLDAIGGWTTILQVIAGLSAAAIYATILVGVKWILYPGWTWRGFFTDAKAVVGLVVFASPFAIWLWKVYRDKPIDAAAAEAVRRHLASPRLPIVSAALAGLASALGAGLVATGELPVEGPLLAYADNSSWSHAREHVDRMAKKPLRQTLIDTFRLYVQVHEMSERDRLKESRSLREDRIKLRQMLDAGEDYQHLNSLSYAEVSKAIHFIEDADGGSTLSDGIRVLLSGLIDRPDVSTRARLLAKAGHLELAAKRYAHARMYLEMALEHESAPVRRARALASLGNAFAALGDLDRATKLYGEAEDHYPDGRRAIFYSNYGYLLLLKGQLDAAERKIDQALKIDPTDWYSYLNRGLIKDERRAYADALLDYREVIARSENPDSRREARIFLGRCLELSGEPMAKYLAAYLDAAGRSSVGAQLTRLQVDNKARAELYTSLAHLLQDTDTHGIERYIRWFRHRADEVGKTAPN